MAISSYQWMIFGHWWGAPVIFDVLAASGAIGVIPFLYFFGTDNSRQFGG